MKTLIVLIFLSISMPCAGFQNPSNFERELSRITSDFREVIMDEDQCEKLKDKAEDITEEIEELLKNPEDFSSEEISQLRQLKTEAKGIEDFIAVVAGIGSSFPKFKDFMAVNERVGADIFYLSKNEFCIDILVVEIDEYRVYLASSNSTKNLRLHVKWKTKDRSSSGNSEVGMVSKSIRHILDNRNNAIKNNIDFQSISCQEF